MFIEYINQYNLPIVDNWCHHKLLIQKIFCQIIWVFYFGIYYYKINLKEKKESCETSKSMLCVRALLLTVLKIYF